MGDKRAAPHDGRSAERSKRNKYFQSNQKAGLPNGSRGFLISCFGGKEVPAAREAISLLSQFYDAGNDGAASSEPAEAADDRPLDLSDAIANEVAEMKDRSSDIFTFHKTHVNGLLFISMAASADKMSTPELARAIAAEIKRTKQCRSRLCIRFLPVEDVCHADIDSIKKRAAVLVERHFPSNPDAVPIEFSVDYEHRASVKLDRMGVINAVADLVPKPPHKVNLTTPSKSILVQLLKSSCALAVADGYRAHSKFNIKELCGLGTSGAPKPAAPIEIGEATVAAAAKQPTLEGQTDATSMPIAASVSAVDAAEPAAS